MSRLTRLVQTMQHAETLHHERYNQPRDWLQFTLVMVCFAVILFVLWGVRRDNVIGDAQMRRVTGAVTPLVLLKGDTNGYPASFPACFAPND